MRRFYYLSVTSLVCIVCQILFTGFVGTSTAHYSADMFDIEGSHLLDKKMKKLFHKLFRRKLKVPPSSTLSLSIQVSRPNIFPKVLNQDEGIIVDGVLDWPMWVELDKFTKAVYDKKLHRPTSSTPGDGDPGEGDPGESGERSISFVGIERCFLYQKLEWLLRTATQLSEEASHSCLIKFVCETQMIHTFHPEYSTSVVFELIHLILTPSLGREDACTEDYLVGENMGRFYGRCELLNQPCPYSVGGILLRNFFPKSSS